MMNKEGAVERLRELAERKVPFVHQGRDLSGIDCVGAWCYGFQFNGPVPEYPEDPVNGELEREMEARLGPPVLTVHRLEPLTTQELLQPLDTLSMQYRGPIRHVAIVVPHIDQHNFPGVLSIIHTDASLGRVTEHILDAKWLRRIVKVWR